VQGDDVTTPADRLDLEKRPVTERELDACLSRAAEVARLGDQDERCEETDVDAWYLRYGSRVFPCTDYMARYDTVRLVAEVRRLRALPPVVERVTLAHQRWGEAPVHRMLLYVCAPYATATADEQAETLEARQGALRRGWTPVWAPFLFRDLLDEGADRETIYALNEALVARSDALLRVGERVTEGMRRELHAWEGLPRGARPTYLWPDLPTVVQRATP
jgi:hypothetical protein